VHLRVFYAKPFGICSPENDDFIKFIVSLEISDILSDDIQVLKFIVARQNVICSVFLVSGNEVWVVDSRQRFEIRHVRLQLKLKIVINDFGSSNRLAYASIADVPAGDGDITRVDHREDIFKRDEDFLSLGNSDFDDG
jgi:hypothetical protein